MIWVRKMICKASQPPFHPNLFFRHRKGVRSGSHLLSIQESVVFYTGSRRVFMDRSVPLKFSHLNVE